MGIVIVLVLALIVFGIVKGLSSSSSSETSQKDTQSRKTVQSDSIEEHYRKKYKRLEAEGLKISWYHFDKWKEYGLPYPCATEQEIKHISHEVNQATRGDIASIFWLINWYKEGMGDESWDYDNRIYKDEEKAMYWKNKLIEMAMSGNRGAQAVLINGLGAKNPIQLGWLNQTEYDLFISQYKERIINDALSGDPEACFAMVLTRMDGTDFSTAKRNNYLKIACDANVEDAYYRLASDYSYEHIMDGGMDYDSPENGQYYEYLLIAAETNRGAHVGYAQYLIADAYNDGEVPGFPKNAEASRHWAQKAVSNGYYEAKRFLN